jgi:hypothetical protein
MQVSNSSNNYFKTFNFRVYFFQNIDYKTSNFLTHYKVQVQLKTSNKLCETSQSKNKTTKKFSVSKSCLKTFQQMNPS